MDGNVYKEDFERYLLTEKRVAHNTFDAYKRDIQQLYDFLERHSYQLQTITHVELKQCIHWLHEQRMSASSMTRKISAFKTLFHFLEERHGFINHARHLIIPKMEKKLPNVIAQDDIEKLFIEARKGTSDQDRRNYTMLFVLYATGMRISELISLRVNDYSATEQVIKIRGKGSKERMVPLQETAVIVLNEYLTHVFPLFSYKVKKNNDILFPTYYNNQLKPMTRQAFWGYIKIIAAQAGIRTISPHNMRHSLATHLLHNGAHLRSIQLLLGHEQLKTVQIYTHVETGHLRKIYDEKHPRA